MFERGIHCWSCILVAFEASLMGYDCYDLDNLDMSIRFVLIMECVIWP